MDSSVLTAIGSVGFPIVAYLLYVTRTDKVVASLTEAVNNNTNAINIMSTKMERENIASSTK